MTTVYALMSYPRNGEIQVRGIFQTRQEAESIAKERNGLWVSSVKKFKSAGEYRVMNALRDREELNRKLATLELKPYERKLLGLTEASQ